MWRDILSNTIVVFASPLVIRAEIGRSPLKGLDHSEILKKYIFYSLAQKILWTLSNKVQKVSYPPEVVSIQISSYYSSS